MNDLTESQKKTFLAVYDYIKEHNFAPTVREIGQMTGRTSPGTIHKSLIILKRKGYIDYQYNRNRTIVILKELEDGS